MGIAGRVAVGHCAVDEGGPVVVSGFVAKVADDGAVSLGELVSEAVAVRVVDVNRRIDLVPFSWREAASW